jgi:uncharacterized Zn-finger protein
MCDYYKAYSPRYVPEIVILCLITTIAIHDFQHLTYTKQLPLPWPGFHPRITKMPSQQGRHRCDYCSRVFSRNEHLQRHRLTRKYFMDSPQSSGLS